VDDAIPQFCYALPQRDAALRAIGRFGELHGANYRVAVERRIPGKRAVVFDCETLDGRRFAIGYEWLPRHEVGL